MEGTRSYPVINYSNYQMCKIFKLSIQFSSMPHQNSSIEYVRDDAAYATITKNFKLGLKTTTH